MTYCASDEAGLHVLRLTRAAASGERALAEKRAVEEDRSLASYISRLIKADSDGKKGAR